MTQTSARTILCIEDDPASRQLVERTLTHAGYNVLVAERGLEGIDMARSQQPDLILTDINLPDISGHEITTALRSDDRFTETPIVALTAQGYGVQRDIALAAGITGYLTKPFSVDQLLEQLDFYLHGGRDSVDAERLSAAQTQYTRTVVNRLESRIRQLEEANAELKKLDRMKEMFIQITAHELRTPLTLIFGYSRLLEDYPMLQSMMTQDEGIRTLVDGLIESITRMHTIIDEIMIVSRIMTNQIDLSIAKINMQSMVRKLATEYKAVCDERNITLLVTPEEWPDDMHGDADLLRLVITNLLGNAIKYTPDGGQIALLAQTEHKTLHFKIRDTGIGIPIEEQARIFEHFHTIGDVKLHSTSKTAFGGGGIGLGLPICKGILEAHGGTISVSSPGYDPETYPGSEFHITLPLKPPLRVRVKAAGKNRTK
jgi:signal transduction histidine kinase